MWDIGKGFHCGSTCNSEDTGDLGSIPGLGRSPEECHGYPLQYSCLKNHMERGAWQATVHRVAGSDMAEATDHTHTNVKRIHILDLKHLLERNTP